ncbi:DUF3095 domain-containing protein [Methylocapsa sp. S129]|uniref:DUF3095 domain-containing protein n=1 Tax=Methylocapsa sp. S129 TaxID=1641869 RepID=UPI00131E1456|nr:DUF3095 domain-containing protein [Methylocapsa sp. S129]
MTNDDLDFYAAIPVFDSFADVMKPSRYRPLPEDWVVGFSDVVGSTKAIAQGRYKAVNMVGAGVIAAVANALERRPFAFVFGGDGASFAVSAADAPLAAEALKAMAVFAQEELQIDLRVATVPVAEVRAAGRDVRVARFAASEHCAYAMFAGGGLAWVETAVKGGAHLLAPAAPGARPDLSDLSCRWSVAPAAHGIVLSLIVVSRGDDARFGALVEEIVAMAMGAQDGGRPITLSSLAARWPGQAIALESAAQAIPGQSRVKLRLAAWTKFTLGVIFHKLKLKAGSFDAVAYASDVADNADFRKFDDGLRMTLDCSAEFADALEERLKAASDIAEYGAFRQDHALMTCFVPSITDRGHVHFVDGAGGGYAMAAQAMKMRRAQA